VDDIAANVVLLNGRVLTLDPARPRATAVAIAGDRIVAVGSDAEIRRRRDRRARVIDLRGATVVPGLVDVHAHVDREGLKFLYPSLAHCRSIADIQTVIRRLAVAALPARGS
jgi:predicted amidohydrolase YtcJ